jgi:hypothetical protein
MVLLGLGTLSTLAVVFTFIDLHVAAIFYIVFVAVFSGEIACAYLAEHQRHREHNDRLHQ